MELRGGISVCACVEYGRVNYLFESYMCACAPEMVSDDSDGYRARRAGRLTLSGSHVSRLVLTVVNSGFKIQLNRPKFVF